MNEIHVVGAAIIRGRKVLIFQRSHHMSMPLKWEFAGGKVEAGETHQQALKREVREELNIDIEVKGFIASGSSVFGDKRILLHVYEADITAGTPVLKEHADMQWAEVDELLSLDWPEADIPACEELVRRYGDID